MFLNQLQICSPEKKNTLKKIVEIMPPTPLLNFFCYATAFMLTCMCWFIVFFLQCRIVQRMSMTFGKLILQITRMSHNLMIVYFTITLNYINMEEWNGIWKRNLVWNGKILVWNGYGMEETLQY